MTILQDILAAVGWQARVTENFRSVSPAGLYGINPATTTGLTLGYLGGEFNGVSVANGTVALTASATNYVVAHRTTGAVTVATNTTNWLNTGTYMQLYQLVAGASTFTIAATSDKRQAFGGTGSGGGGSVAGSDKQIQYNASGSFGAEAGFEYDYSTNTLSVANATFTGLALTAASTTGGAGLRLPHGTAPTTPTNGDLWTTTGGLYARINGATVGPFVTSVSGMTNPMTTTGDIIYSSSGSTPARLGIGSTNQVLTVIAGVPSWQTPSGGGGLTNFTEAATSAAPNGTVPVVSLAATNAATNVDAALVPKGSGALLGIVPDSTTTGGNKRGAFATDWQRVRNTVSQVASGNNSTIGGGTRNTASGAASVVAGGTTNTAGSVEDTVCGGSGNAASGGQAFVGGGASNTASGNYSSVVGGFTNTASGIYSIAFGARATTRGIQGAMVHAGGMVATAGDSQIGRYVLTGQTFNATPLAIGVGTQAVGAGTTVVLPNGATYDFTMNVVARVSGGATTASWKIEGTIKRDANAASTALVGTPVVTAKGAVGSALSISAVADTTNGSLNLQVTGLASTAVNWVALVETVECIA